MHVLVSCCSDQCPVIIQFHIPQVCATQYSVHIPQVATQYARVQDDVWVEAASSKVRLAPRRSAPPTPPTPTCNEEHAAACRRRQACSSDYNSIQVLYS